MRLRAQLSAAFACAGILFLASCSDPKSTGVTEGGNTGAIAGIVVDSSGMPVPNALVRLRAASYVKAVDTTSTALLKVAATIDSTQDSLPALDTYTNQNGEYYLDSVPVGDYSIETRYTDSASNVFATWRSAKLVEEKPLELSPDTLQQPATVRGRVSGSLLIQGYHYIQILGLDRIEQVNESTGVFEIKDLPPGEFRIRFITGNNEIEPSRILNLELSENEDEDLGEVEEEDGDD